MLHFGRGSIEHLAPTVGAFGRSVLLAYGGGSVKRSGLHDTILGILRDGGFQG